MTPPPDPSTIDWGQITLWGTSIGGIIGSVGAAIWLGVRRAMKVAETLPAPIAAVHKTDVYTTDSVALQELSRSLEAANVLMTEGNALRREATDERRTLRQALDENTEATEKSLAAITELRQDLRQLTSEMIRMAERLRG